MGKPLPSDDFLLHHIFSRCGYSWVKSLEIFIPKILPLVRTSRCARIYGRLSRDSRLKHALFLFNFHDFLCHLYSNHDFQKFEEESFQVECKETTDGFSGESRV